VGIYGIKPWFQRRLQPLVPLLSGVHPDVLTWSALVLSLVAGSLLYSATPEQAWMAILVVPLLGGRLALNALDGMVAKQTGKARAAGEVINELCDRLSDVAIFLPLAFRADVRPQLVLLAIVSMLIVSFTGVLGKAVGAERVYAGVLGKADRMIWLMAACLGYACVREQQVMGFTVFEVLCVMFVPLASLTLLQRLNRIFQLLSEKRSGV
jgi:CDP-diacylglycerol---glycerol-3-phosphate 3-phosphatidyltransferase